MTVFAVNSRKYAKVTITIVYGLGTPGSPSHTTRHTPWTSHKRHHSHTALSPKDIRHHSRHHCTRQTSLDSSYQYRIIKHVKPVKLLYIKHGKLFTVLAAASHKKALVTWQVTKQITKNHIIPLYSVFFFCFSRYEGKTPGIFLL